MEFVHACCLSLYLQFQCLGGRIHRGGSANRTKGSTAMSPGWRPSKRLRSTPLEQATHEVCSWRSTTGKRVEVAAVGEHNSPSRPTPRPRDQFQVHELTGDIGHDGTLPNLERDSSWTDDYSPTEEEPSQQTPISPHLQNTKICQGWYYLTDVYQSICSSYLISM
jgi:hypothetical protein